MPLKRHARRILGSWKSSKSEPTLALPVVWITKSNYKRLFTDKFLKKSDVCVGSFKKYC